MNKNTYESPLCSRYASERMQYIFSPDYKFLTWHRLWLALAENEHALGLNVTAEQVEELRENLDIIDYEAAEKYERALRHDVMAHIRAWGDHCPKARGIIHLGATSCYVDDNGDLIAYREAMRQIRMLLVNAITAIADFAEKNADVPVLAYTHYQAAQPTTVGKRACMWAQDLMFDLETAGLRARAHTLLRLQGRDRHRRELPRPLRRRRGQGRGAGGAHRARHGL